MTWWIVEMTGDGGRKVAEIIGCGNSQSEAIEIAKKRWPGYGCSSVKKTDKVG